MGNIAWREFSKCEPAAGAVAVAGGFFLDPELNADVVAGGGVGECYMEDYEDVDSAVD